jgi:hypothetical protein
MNDLKEIKLWDDWDDINLSTSERRIERLEILRCKKNSSRRGYILMPTSFRVLEKSHDSAEARKYFFQRV